MNAGRTPRSVRLPEKLQERLEALAAAHGISVSAAHRLALQRGLAAFEREVVQDAVFVDAPVTPTGTTTAPGRRVLSKGVGY